MKVVKLTSSLGEQMFQYAFFLAVRRAAGGDVCRLAGKQFQLPRFMAVTGQYEPARRFPWSRDLHRGLARIVEPADGAYWPEAIGSAPRDAIFEGRWLSYRYFEKIEEEVCREFQIVAPVPPKLQPLHQAIADGETALLHIDSRRATRDYYNWAIANLAAFVPQAQLFVVTDSPQWVKRNIVGLATQATVLNCKGLDVHAMMQLMEAASHTVITASLADWWAAYLNPNPDKIIIAPQRWGITTPPHLMPLHWTIIPVT